MSVLAAVLDACIMAIRRDLVHVSRCRFDWALVQVSEGGGGGFASIRTKNFDPPLELGAYEGLELRLRGDGQRYKCAPNPTHRSIPKPPAARAVTG